MWRSDHCQYYRLMWHIPHRKMMHRYAYCTILKKVSCLWGRDSNFIFISSWTDPHKWFLRVGPRLLWQASHCNTNWWGFWRKKTVKRWARCAILSTTNLLKLNWWFVKCRQCSDLFANIWSKLTKSQCSLFLIFVWLHFYEQKTKQGLLNLATSFDGILHSMVFKFAKRNLFCHL